MWVGCHTIIRGAGGKSMSLSSISSCMDVGRHSLVATMISSLKQLLSQTLHLTWPYMSLLFEGGGGQVLSLFIYIAGALGIL